MTSVETLIVGAGPAGLATAGRLRKRNKPFTVIEKVENVASSWRAHYDRLHLHTVKQLSHLPHMQFPDSYPTYVSRDQLIAYMESYAESFDIRPIYNSEVISVGVRGDDGYRIVETSGGETYRTQHLVIATGVNRVPNIPAWPGQETFTGEIVHSRFYKNAEPYAGKSVLVVGFGNTGAEVALDLCNNDADVGVVIRTAITIVPRDVFGRPVQLTARKLAKIPFGIGDWLGSQIRRFIIGNLSKHGVPVSNGHPAVQLRETGKTPVIDLGTAKKIQDGEIKVFRDIQSIEENTVAFTDGSTFEADVILLATGYKSSLDDFIPGIGRMLDSNGYPNTSVGKGEFDGIYFVGFNVYELGGVFGTIQTDTLDVIGAICGEAVTD